MSDNELLVRIDERTTTILERLEDLQARSDRLDKAVFIGMVNRLAGAREHTRNTVYAVHGHLR